MSAELVPVDNMTALEALDAQSREVAVTQMLSEARQWLAHAVEATEPARVAEFKAFVATIAETTKQLNLSKEIQLDATEMVRRAERGVGVAIRKGQAEGTVRTGRENLRNVGVRLSDSEPASPLEFASRPELYGGRGADGLLALADDVTDEQFDAAITEAKAEGNLSRANVVRKVKGETAPKLERPEYLRGTHRRYDLTKSVEASVQALENIAFALRFERSNENPDYKTLPSTERAEWVTRSREALRDINRFLKELT